MNKIRRFPKRVSRNPELIVKTLTSILFMFLFVGFACSNNKAREYPDDGFPQIQEMGGGIYSVVVTCDINRALTQGGFQWDIKEASPNDISPSANCKEGDRQMMELFNFTDRVVKDTRPYPRFPENPAEFYRLDSSQPIIEQIVGKMNARGYTPADIYQLASIGAGLSKGPLATVGTYFPRRKGDRNLAAFPQIKSYDCISPECIKSSEKFLESTVHWEPDHQWFVGVRSVRKQPDPQKGGKERK